MSQTSKFCTGKIESIYNWVSSEKFRVLKRPFFTGENFSPFDKGAEFCAMGMPMPMVIIKVIIGKLKNKDGNAFFWRW